MQRKQDAENRPKNALIIIDMMNSFDFEGADKLLPKAEEAAERLAELKREARGEGAPVIYVNDNYGHWTSNFQATVAAAKKSKGKNVARALEPEEDDYSVLKPRNSGFHATPLAELLEHLGVKRLVVGGLATNICVLYTVQDARMRHYEVVVVEDGVAAEDNDSHSFALAQMKQFLGVEVKPAKAVSFSAAEESG